MALSSQHHTQQTQSQEGYVVKGLMKG